MTNPEDPALIDLDSTRDAHRRLTLALEDLKAVSPEAAALQNVLYLVGDSLVGRGVRDQCADEKNHAERELQFLSDLRAAADWKLTGAVPYAQNKRGLTWQRIGDLLGISRQAAHERYSVRAAGNTRP